MKALIIFSHYKNIMRICFVFLMCILNGCGEHQEEAKPRISAYSDGFEVVVKKNDGHFTAVHLKDAELLANSGVQFTFSQKDIDKIKNDLNVESNTSARQSTFVELLIDPKSNSEQIIELSFHLSKSTYLYKYKVMDRQLIPLSSSYKDMTVHRNVNYE